MKMKHLILGLVVFGFFTVCFFNYLSHKLDTEIQEKNNTKIAEAYVLKLLPKPIEI